MERGNLKKQILLVEGNKRHIELIRSVLKKQLPEVSVDPVATLQTALKRLKEKEYQLILSDFILKNVCGAELIRKLKEASPHTPLIVVTGKGDHDTPSEVIKMGADDYVVKNRESLKTLPHMVEKFLLRRKFSFAGPLTAVPLPLVKKIGTELDLLLARSNLIAKNAANTEIIDSIQEQINKLKKIAQKILP